MLGQGLEWGLTLALT